MEGRWVMKYLRLCLCSGLRLIWMNNDLEYTEETNMHWKNMEWHLLKA